MGKQNAINVDWVSETMSKLNATLADFDVKKLQSVGGQLARLKEKTSGDSSSGAIFRDMANFVSQITKMSSLPDN